VQSHTLVGCASGESCAENVMEMYVKVVYLYTHSMILVNDFF